MPAVSARLDSSHLLPPADRVLWKRVDQHVAEIAPVDLRSLAATAARPVEQYAPLIVHDPLGVLAGPNAF